MTTKPTLPSAGGSYVRDPETGKLQRADALPSGAKKATKKPSAKDKES